MKPWIHWMFGITQHSRKYPSILSASDHSRELLSIYPLVPYFVQSSESIRSYLRLFNLQQHSIIYSCLPTSHTTNPYPQKETSTYTIRTFFHPLVNIIPKLYFPFPSAYQLFRSKPWSLYPPLKAHWDFFKPDHTTEKNTKQNIQQLTTSWPK